MEGKLLQNAAEEARETAKEQYANHKPGDRLIKTNYQQGPMPQTGQIMSPNKNFKAFTALMPHSVLVMMKNIK